mmetsp:Transcript_77192/g.213412  ORF Transcript_77192/g.213412 Transcript_77192/m.213412 type:complete len:220 (+) Transcript_77192:1239-1898(+)
MARGAHVGVANSLNLVNLVLLSECVKRAEQFVQEDHNLRGGEGLCDVGPTNDVREENCDALVALRDHGLTALQTLNDVWGHDGVKELRVLCILHLNAVEALDLHGRAHPGLQDLWVERLGNVIVASHSEALGDAGLFRRGRQHEDGQHGRREAVLVTEYLANLVPGKPGHLGIEEHDIRQPGVRDKVIEAFLSVHGHVDFVRVAERHLDNGLVHRVIVH